jgi:hypothetical protein
MNRPTEPLTDDERQALEWYRAADRRATAVPDRVRAALVRRYLLIRLTPPGGPLYAIGPRGMRALGAPPGT